MTDVKEELMEKMSKNNHFENGGCVLVFAPIPCIREEDIMLEIWGNILKITAMTFKGKLEKDIRLMEGGDVEEIKEASIKNGILKIKLSRKEK